MASIAAHALAQAATEEAPKQRGGVRGVWGLAIGSIGGGIAEA